ncbi:MAG TPA: tetratricopeptide repeat protein, partial [Thermoanaerobaculia bacterium]
MNAAISGQAGVAFLLDGKDISVLRVDRPGGVVRCQPNEIPFYLGDAKDLQFLERVDEAEARRQLELANDQIDALHLALILLDSSLSEDTRATAAEELEELLGIDKFQVFVEKVLLARPLPSGVNVSESVAYCREYPLARALLERIDYLQEAITEVYLAWEGVPESVFLENENREYAQTIAVREGFFRDLTNLCAAATSVDNFLISALLNVRFRTIRNHREVLQAWVAPLRLNRQLASPRADVDLNDEYPELSSEDDQKSRGGAYLLEKINRQKDSIVSAMIQRRFDKMDEYLEDLIDFQLKSGGPIYACKSLCDLAMNAKRLGHYKLQLDLTVRAVKLKDDDGWSWSQYADALLQNGQLIKALEAYNTALLYCNYVEARNGRADVLKSQNRLDEALSAYESVIAEFPGDVVARNGRADVLKSQNRLDEALSAYKSVIAEFPGNVVARSGRAEVLKSQNRLDEALSAYESVIAEFPGDVV